MISPAVASRVGVSMPLVPTNLVNPNGIQLRLNNFDCNLAMDTATGLAQILRLTSDLYLAELDDRVFWQEWQSSKEEKLGGLLYLIQNQDQQPRKYFDFHMAMLHTALLESWRLPALVVRHKGHLTWHTGGVRLLATGMCGRPQHLKILVQDFDRSPTQDIRIIKHLHNDRDLAEILGVDYHPYNQHKGNLSTITGQAWLEWHNQPGPVLHYFRPGSGMGLDWANHDSDLRYINACLEETATWQRPRKLLYWADRADQVISSHGTFALYHQGPCQGPSPGLLDKTVYDTSKRVPSDDAVRLWVRPGRTLDADELLFWVNTGYNVYHDCDDHFAFLISTGGRMDTLRIKISNHAQTH